MATPIPSNLAEFTLQEIQRIVGAEWLGNGTDQSRADLSVVGVETDSRKSLNGKLFVALGGDHFDAHQFVAQAERAGAVAALVERRVDTAGHMPQLRVKSCLAALGELARAHRSRFQLPVIAVAGSCGKTTTKAILGALLRETLTRPVLVTPGNLNNLIGAPMVLLRLSQEHQAAVVEVGTNQPGEVARLTEIVAPTASILTLIDVEHSEGLGDLDSIEMEESAVLRDVGIAIGNTDDARVARQLASSGARVVSYGTTASADYRVTMSSVGVKGSELVVQRPATEALKFRAPLYGEPQGLAVAAATAVVEQVLGCSVSARQIADSLTKDGVLPAGRLRVVELSDGSLVVDDAYNANPASVNAAIKVAYQLAANGDGALRRVHLVLGEMRELGRLSEREHCRIGDRLAHLAPTSVTAVAGDARLFLRGLAQDSASSFVGNWQSAWDALAPELQPGDVVLVKGSRGVQLDCLVNAMLSEIGEN